MALSDVFLQDPGPGQPFAPEGQAFGGGPLLPEPDFAGTIFGDGGEAGGLDINALLQSIIEQLSKAPAQRPGGPAGDIAGGIRDRGAARVDGGVQDIGAFQRSELRDFIKEQIGRDPRAKTRVTIDGIRFERDARGNVVPLQRVVTEPFEPAEEGGPRLTTAETREAFPEGVAAAVPGAVPTIRGITPDVSAEVQRRAETALSQAEATEAEALPEALEGQLLGAAAELQPGDNPEQIFRAVLQRARTTDDAAERRRLKTAFDQAFKVATLQQRGEEAKERRAFTAEQREFQREARASLKEQDVARKQAQAIQTGVEDFATLKRRLAGEAQKIIKDARSANIRPADAEARLEQIAKELTDAFGLLEPAVQGRLRLLGQDVTEADVPEADAAPSREPARVRAEQIAGEPLESIVGRLAGPGRQEPGAAREETTTFAGEVLPVVEAGDTIRGHPNITPLQGRSLKFRARVKAEIARLKAAGATNDDALAVVEAALRELVERGRGVPPG